MHFIIYTVMKKYTLFPLLVLLLFACGKEKSKSRFNYTLIKEKINIQDDQVEQFDQITEEYAVLGYKTYNENKDDRTVLMEKLKVLGNEQDAEIKKILTEKQYLIYKEEIEIERSGREKHNVKLIKAELNLDSTQALQYDQANAVFYKSLVDNHDNYHGKPDVYRQYYDELDKSRRAALQDVLTEEQFQEYLTLVEKYNVGKSEH